MSKNGYWQHNWLKRDIEARRSDEVMHSHMRQWGYTFVRPATNEEDRIYKFDYVWKKADRVYYIDYKTCAGVQDSHRKLYDEGNLGCTHYLRMHGGRINLKPVKWFWEHTRLEKKINRGGQVYWEVPNFYYRPKTLNKLN